MNIQTEKLVITVRSVKAEGKQGVNPYRRHLVHAERLQESKAPTYSCFNCDSLGGGRYKAHEAPTRWFIGHFAGLAHYACEECKDQLYEPTVVA